MDTNLSTLKNLAVSLGCCECTEDNPATNNSEAIDFICDNIGNLASDGVIGISLTISKNGKIKSGKWTDTAGKKHDIEIIGG